MLRVKNNYELGLRLGLSLGLGLRSSFRAVVSVLVMVLVLNVKFGWGHSDQEHFADIVPILKDKKCSTAVVIKADAIRCI